MKRIICLCLLALFAASHGQAAEFCVANGNQLQNALLAAEDNGQDDVIRVRAGIYTRAATFEAFDYWSDENFDLTLIGGWNTDCSARSATALSRLDGEDERRVMRIINAGAGTDVTLTVQWLHFEGGMADGSGGGLEIAGTGGTGTSIVVEHTTFIGNTASASGGGLDARGNGAMRLRNNLFIANDADSDYGAVSLTSNNDVAIVSSNTIIANTSPGPTLTGGLRFNGSSTLLLFNNILSGNEGLDLRVFSGVTHQRMHNTIEDISAPSPVNLSGEITTSPTFLPGVFNLDPRPGGAQYNGGHSTPTGGLPSVDLNGRPRIAGGRVDMGAFESPVLFYDGFDRHPTVD